MDKQICFLINDESLFLDKVLVAFNDTPIFFVCCDNNSCYYLALCTDIENLEYIVVKASLEMIYRVLTQKIEMREPFTAASCFWEVKAGTSIQEDEVRLLDGKNIDLEVLPYPGAVYETINKSDEAYVEQIKGYYFNVADFETLPVTDLEYSSDDTIEILAVNMHPVVQYVELSTKPGRPFSGLVKMFECSGAEKEDMYFYTEQMVQTTETMINNKAINDIVQGRIASLADAA